MKDTFSHCISQTRSDIAICCHLEQRYVSLFHFFFWLLKAQERTFKILAEENDFLFCHLRLSIIRYITKPHLFLFNKDCPNCWSLKPVYIKYITDTFRVWLFNNPTPRRHYFPIWNMCRYFQTQSLAFCAKYNISHVSFILNAPVEAINNTCHCTEKIPSEMGFFFFYSDDQ